MVAWCFEDGNNWNSFAIKIYCRLCEKLPSFSQAGVQVNYKALK